MQIATYNKSMILTDYVTGEELQTLPYGNKSFSMTVFGDRVIHAPVSLMLSEISHTGKDKYCMLLLICEI